MHSTTNTDIGIVGPRALTTAEKQSLDRLEHTITIPCTVLDLFCGVGIELNPDHARMAERRLTRAMEARQ